MTAQHVLDRLPLWVGGDLDEAATAEVDAHLAACERCSAAAQALQKSQAWLKEASEAPFDEADHAALRRSVMARLQAEPEASLLDRIQAFLRGSRLLLAAAAALLCAVATWARLHPGQMPGAPAVATQVPTPVVAPAAPIKTGTPLPAQPTRPQLARVHARPLPTPATAAPDQGPARIELQTSNPHIRIIWLAKAMPEPDPIAAHHEPS